MVRLISLYLSCFWQLTSVRRKGPISSLTVMGQTIIIVNDLEVASEILEKRSVKHSSRPKSTFAGEM